ncbi:MAG: chromosomal replication initiator DnaA [Methylocystis sp.]|nr:MAG: chromosomal replication initiator DnaA [Methylocystis sp.]
MTAQLSSSQPIIAGMSIAAAAAVAGVPSRAIASPFRCRAPVARARQLAVYLHHVALGASLSACARHFCRDRATVRHACAVIEDLRDDPAFDCWATRLETSLMAQRDMVAALVAEAQGAAR